VESTWAQTARTEVHWLGKVDVIVITHDHADHLGTIGRTDGSSAAAGLIQTMIDRGWVSAEQGIRFGKGGTVTPLGPQIKITQVRAEHSSEVTLVDPTTKKTQPRTDDTLTF